MFYLVRGQPTDTRLSVEEIDTSKICFKKIIWKWSLIQSILKKIINKQMFIWQKIEFSA